MCTFVCDCAEKIWSGDYDNDEKQGKIPKGGGLYPSLSFHPPPPSTICCMQQDHPTSTSMTITMRKMSQCGVEEKTVNPETQESRTTKRNPYTNPYFIAFQLKHVRWGYTKRSPPPIRAMPCLQQRLLVLPQPLCVKARSGSLRCCHDKRG